MKPPAIILPWMVFASWQIPVFLMVRIPTIRRLFQSLCAKKAHLIFLAQGLHPEFTHAQKALQHLLDTDMGNQKCKILKPSILSETGIHLEILSDYSVFLCFLSEKDTFLCIYLKETSIGQALDDYLCSLTEEDAVYTQKEARQLLLGLLEGLSS